MYGMRYRVPGTGYRVPGTGYFFKNLAHRTPDLDPNPRPKVLDPDLKKVMNPVLLHGIQLT
jgi:hypothetical protein